MSRTPRRGRCVLAGWLAAVLIGALPAMADAQDIEHTVTVEQDGQAVLVGEIVVDKRAPDSELWRGLRSCSLTPLPGHPDLDGPWQPRETSLWGDVRVKIGGRSRAGLEVATVELPLVRAPAEEATWRVHDHWLRENDPTRSAVTQPRGGRPGEDNQAVGLVALRYSAALALLLGM